MLVPDKPFQPDLFVGNARSLPCSGAPEIAPLR
jgi:hypothetical protein